MEEEGFMTYPAASHQGEMQTLWLHFRGAVMSSILIYIQWRRQNVAPSPPGDCKLNFINKTIFKIMNKIMFYSDSGFKYYNTHKPQRQSGA